MIDNKKCINCQNDDGYYLISAYDHIDEVQAYFYSDDKKTGIISINIEGYNKRTGTSYSLANPLIKYQFQKEIRNVMISNIGQEKLMLVVIFLMEDGTLNYADIYKGLQSNNLSSYKEIKNIEDITTLYQASTCVGETCNAGTILAQKTMAVFMI